MVSHFEMASSDSDWSVQGKVCLVTGADKGIGYETALELVHRGAGKVILTSKCLSAAKRAASDIAEKTGVDQDRISSIHLDLSSFHSIRQSTDKIIETEPELHVLINNQSHLNTTQKRKLSKNGYELTFAINHLGHFLLTELLLPLLRQSAPSRVVIVTSSLHILCHPHGLNVDDLNLAKRGSYESLKAYAQSKLANILFARSLQTRLNGVTPKTDEPRPPSSGVSVFVALSGFAETALLQKGPSISKKLVKVFGELSATAWATSVYCACEPGIEQFTGGYFNWHSKIWGIAKDDEKAAKLWQLSEEMVANASN